ncbi:MAG: hypothetical protein M0R80_25370 [Proteobacteria bacterium]|nr:hypothetical protein [Pseudomonadota bacterium]
MKTVMCVSMTALFLVLVAGCSEPAPPPAEPDKPAPMLAPVAEIPKAPAPAVPQAEIEKAVGLYKVLNDAALSDEQKQEQAAAQLQANGWTEEAYQALLYDIAQDQPSRAAYVEMTGAK